MLHVVNILFIPLLLAESLDPKFQLTRHTYDQSENSGDHRIFLLTEGEEKLVDFDFEMNERSISIGNSKLLGTPTIINKNGTSVVTFRPTAKGEGSITVRDKDGNLRVFGTLRVTGSNLLRLSQDIETLLKDVEGLRIRVIGSKIVLDGEIMVPSEYGRVFMVASDPTYDKLLLNLVTLSPYALNFTAKKIQADINAFAPQVTARVVNNVIFLEGAVDDPEHKKRAVELANLYIPDARPPALLDRDPSAQKVAGRPIVQDFIGLNPMGARRPEKLIKIGVYFVEFDKNYEKNAGFKWQPGFTTDPQIAIGINPNGQAATSGSNFAGTIASLFPRMNSMQTAQYSRVLKQGTLIVRSGKEGRLEDTIQFPVTTTALNGQTTVTPYPIGIRVSIRPEIIGNTQDIDLIVDLSQKATQGSPAAGGPPLASAHAVNTELYVKSGESAAVAGMSASSLRTSFNSDPNPGSFGADTVPLFTLIRSKLNERSQLQFVVFVAPEIIESASEATEDLKRNFRIKAD